MSTPSPSRLKFDGNTKKRVQWRKDALVAWNRYQMTRLPARAEEADAWLAELEAGRRAVPPKCQESRGAAQRAVRTNRH